MTIVLPTFLCVGAQKAATTTLQAILIQHPNIFLAQPKEAHFFDRDENYKKGVEWYHEEYFSEHKHEKAIGDITPEYMFCEKSPSRIRATLGDSVKLIFLLRNPVERAYSQYLMSLRRGYENLSFPDAILAEKERMAKGEFEHWHFSYLSRGYYFVQVSRFMELFQKRNMFFIILETDFLQKRRETINNLLRFLGVETEELRLNIKANPARLPRSAIVNYLLRKDNPIKKAIGLLMPSRSFRQSIKESIDRMNLRELEKTVLSRVVAQHVFETYFRDDVANLELAIGRDLGVWKHPRGGGF